MQVTGLKFKAYDVIDSLEICESFTLPGLIAEIEAKSSTPVPELFELRIVGQDVNFLIPTNIYSKRVKATIYQAREYVRKMKKRANYLALSGHQVVAKHFSVRCDINVSEEEQVKQYMDSNQLEFLKYEDLLKAEESLIKELKF